MNVSYWLRQKFLAEHELYAINVLVDYINKCDEEIYAERIVQLCLTGK